jgi:hypothetical protein
MSDKRTDGVCRSRDAAGIAEYADGIMGPGERKKFERHLLGCASCRTAVEGLRNDLAVMNRPAFPVLALRTLLARMSGSARPVIRLLADGLDVRNAGTGRRLIPGFAPAVRGTERRRIRTVSLPFSFPAVSGSATLVFRNRESATLECRIDRCGMRGIKKIAVFGGGRLLEEKTMAERGGIAAEFGPVGKGDYSLRINGKKIFSLRIV